MLKELSAAQSDITVVCSHDTETLKLLQRRGQTDS